MRETALKRFNNHLIKGQKERHRNKVSERKKAGVAPMMEELIKWNGGRAQKLHPAERAARVHAEFVKAHPTLS
jgi:hypothetical protein